MKMVFWCRLASLHIPLCQSSSVIITSNSYTILHQFETAWICCWMTTNQKWSLNTCIYCLCLLFSHSFTRSGHRCSLAVRIAKERPILISVLDPWKLEITVLLSDLNSFISLAQRKGIRFTILILSNLAINCHTFTKTFIHIVSQL